PRVLHPRLASPSRCSSLAMPAMRVRRPCPTGPTVFPYTTLFRSQRRRNAVAVDGGDNTVAVGSEHEGRRDIDGLVKIHRHGHVLDRKSTRLNSSHVKISYAVFCLKKKMSRKASTSFTLVAGTSGG